MSDALIEGFEEHLREQPDYLTDQGDPRGEFMAVQIALERKDLPAKERTRFKKLEKKLLADPARWLGPDLAETIEETRPQHQDSVHLTFQRGWLAGLRLDLLGMESGPQRLLEAIAAAPEARWGLSLTINPPDRTDISPLAQSSFMPVLRRLHIGGDEENSHADRVSGQELIFDKAARLESVALCMNEPAAGALFRSHLPNLREIVVGCAWSFSTDQLPANASFRNLRTLRLVPGYVESEDPGLTLDNLEHICFAPDLVSLAELRFSISNAGDDGIEMLIRSGLLHRLEVLDLSHGNVTDAGAALIARALTDRAGRLRVLNLNDNALTSAGSKALRTLGVELHVRQQHDPDDEGYRDHGNRE